MKQSMRSCALLACWITTLLAIAWGSLTARAGSLIDSIPARSIGPAAMGGRIVDIEGVDSDPKTIYVAAATGGLWKTTDGGDSWAPLFDQQTTLCMGAVAIAPSNPNILWVGSGEANPRNSVSWGDGVYKSIDAGKTWKNMGLKLTRHIGRVVINPANPDIVYVAAMGDFWGPNKERGIYKTTDGGNTWEQIKFISEDTGFIDLAIDPGDPNILYAAAWRVRRDAFAGGNPMTETGANGGLYKSIDGGKIWEKLTVGLPDQPMGRCGIAIYRKDPNVIYAVIQTDLTNNGTTGQPANGGRGAQGRGGQAARGGRGGPPPSDGTDVSIGGIFRSTDKGHSWTKMNDLVPRPFYYGQIRIDPNDDQRIYVLGTNFAWSDDGGKTFQQLGGGGGGGGRGGFAGRGRGGAGGAGGESESETTDVAQEQPATQAAGTQVAATQEATTQGVAQGPGRGRGAGGGGGGGGVHPDNHALWIDPTDPTRLFLGNDGGLYISRNRARTWEPIRGVPIGQFYGIAVDMRTPYRVYGGLQDNGSWAGPSATRSPEGITIADWRSILGGDGFEAASDPNDSDIVYVESQNGTISRVNMALVGGRGRGASVNIQPGRGRGRGGAGGGFGRGRGGAGAATTAPETAPATAPAAGLAAVSVIGGPAAVATAIIDSNGTATTMPVAVAQASPATEPQSESAQSQPATQPGRGRGFGRGFAFGGAAATAPSGPQYRFNWDAPILLSPHNSNTLYLGGNVLFKSTNRGDTWTPISPDLTRGSLTTPRDAAGGGSPHTLTTIAESPLNADVLWVGTDDGRVHVTRDGGKEWTEISDKAIGLPPDRWIMRVECSYTAEGAAYLAIDRHHHSDLKPYLFKTTDFGQTWTSIAGNLPPEAPVHVVRESSKNKNLLFAGTENGLFYTLDGGGHWDHITSGMPPAVPVYDLVIHPRDRELVIGTHGRSIYIMDIAPLEQLTSDILARQVYLFDQKVATLLKPAEPSTQPAATQTATAAHAYKAPNPPAAAVLYYYLGKAAQAASLTITDAAGKVIATLPASGEPGLHRIEWDPRTAGLVGDALKDLKLKLQVGTEPLVKPLTVQAEQ